MNKTINNLFLWLLIFGSLSSSLKAQSKVLIAPEVIAPAGMHYTQGQVEMSWTIGQTAINTFSNSVYWLTQGFHQSEDVFLNVIGHPQQRIVITPNSDGLNDVFVLEDLQNYPNNELIIFNRWGSVVYTEASYENNWRGTTQNGQELPEATYYFSLKLSTVNREILYGSITIKR